MKNASQITFEFQDPPEAGENPGVGVRIKSLKKTSDAGRDKQAENRNIQESLFNSATADDLPSESADEPSTQSSPGADEAGIDNAGLQFASTHESETDIIGTPEVFAATQPADGIDSTEVLDFSSTAHGGQPDAPLKFPKSTRGRKSLKTIDEGSELINVPPDEQLFQKQYYAIGEVAEMFHVNQSLLRFWETEFDIIQPRKNRKGDRHFRPVDIKNLLLIHDLLRRRKLTIEGAKDFLKKNKRSPERFAMIQSLQRIKGFILEIKATL
jgi:DNA-binding transcriptional MerR regulator